MLIYAILLSAIIVIAYLIQFQLYHHSRRKISGMELFEIPDEPLKIT